MRMQLASTKLLFATLLALSVAACGFQLRGVYTLPFATLYISLPDSTELYAQIRRSIESGSSTRIVANASAADARLTVITDTSQKNILSLSAAGRVTEFELVRTFVFRLTDKTGAEILASSRIILRRELTFSDDQVLSKDAEELLLWRDIQHDLVQQLMRRLVAAKPVASDSQPAVK